MNVFRACLLSAVAVVLALHTEVLALPGDIFYWTGDAGTNNWTDNDNWARTFATPGGGSDNDPGQDDTNDAAIFAPNDTANPGTSLTNKQKNARLNASRLIGTLTIAGDYTGLVGVNNGATLTLSTEDAAGFAADIGGALEILGDLVTFFSIPLPLDIIIRSGGRIDVGALGDPGNLTAGAIFLEPGAVLHLAQGSCLRGSIRSGGDIVASGTDCGGPSAPFTIQPGTFVGSAPVAVTEPASVVLALVSLLAMATYRPRRPR